MRQLNYIRKNRLEWFDARAPELVLPTDAIVRPLAAARCDGDKVFLFHDFSGLMRLGVALHYLDPVITEMLGPRPFKGPFAIGHECVGEVVSVGPEVSAFRAGDTVVVPWAVSCGRCARCMARLTSKCLSAGGTMLSGYGFGSSMGEWGGMVSDAIRVPFADEMLVSVPADIDLTALASASDNIPDGWRTVAPLLIKWPGAPVLVVGGGAESIGLYAAGIAVALGSTRVDYVDSDLGRLAIAETLGATPVEIPAKRSSRWYRANPAEPGAAAYPITVDASADPDGLRFAIRSLAPGGTCTSVGYYFQAGTALPLMRMFANDSTLHTGVSHPRAALPDVLALIAGGRFRPELVNTLVAPWEHADQAFLERTTKVVVHRPRLAPEGSIAAN